MYLSAGYMDERGDAPAHNPKVQFNEEVCPIGSACLAHCAVRWLAAVSYTHLDVYKRQVQTAPIGVLNFIVFDKMNWGVIAAGAIVIALPVIFFGIAIRKYYVKAVSYTHLDVYKRQHPRRLCKHGRIGAVGRRGNRHPAD